VGKIEACLIGEARGSHRPAKDHTQLKRALRQGLTVRAPRTPSGPCHVFAGQQGPHHGALVILSYVDHSPASSNAEMSSSNGFTATMMPQPAVQGPPNALSSAWGHAVTVRSTRSAARSGYWLA